ncbi:hypothetical protein ACFLRM_04585 [Acidobacteriota bacterium]
MFKTAILRYGKIYLMFFFLALLVLSGFMCKKSPTTPGGSENGTTTPQNQLYDEYKQVAGTWTGQWRNNTFNSSGNNTASVEVNPDGTATGTLDLGGFVFGLPDPDPKTFSGTYDANGIVFDVQDNLFGDLKITITRTGENTGTVDIDAQNIPASGINSMTATGSITPTTLHLDYTVNFSDGSSATGVFNMSRTN